MMPDKNILDPNTDIIDLGEILPGGSVGNTVHDNLLGYTYPFTASSENHSTIVRYVLKTGNSDNSSGRLSMVVDIGGNCGFCRAYIHGENRDCIMFGWEIKGCTSSRAAYHFDDDSWYAFEQGRVRVTCGPELGKDYVYLKINGELVSAFYGDSESRPMRGGRIYVEASDAAQIIGFDEIRVKYYADGALYLDQPSQRGLFIRKPEAPAKDGQYFMGWFADACGGALFDFAHPPMCNEICVYAMFTGDCVRVVFDPANGDPPFSRLTGKSGITTEPPAPVSPDHEFVFSGWRNEITGKIHDFSADRVDADTVFSAVYREAEHRVCYYALGKCVQKVPFVMSAPTVRGREPEVPLVPYTHGSWEEHAVDGLTGDCSVHARYAVNMPASDGRIRLCVFAGGAVDLTPDSVRDYLSAEEAGREHIVKEYRSDTHGRQDLQNTHFSWTDCGENKSYTVYFSASPAFDDAFIIRTEKTELSCAVGIFQPGKTYFWCVCGDDTGSFSDIDCFSAAGAVRFITAGGVANMRDLGGQKSYDGKLVRYGLLYRGAALDETSSHVDDPARQVIHYLGIRSEIELRGDHMHRSVGWDENQSSVYCIKADGYQSVFSLDDEGKSTFRAAFAALADERNYPFYFHCSAGADRTGTFAFLLYALLGVPYPAIRTEYELTSFSRFGPRRAAYFSDTDSLDMTCRRMITVYGDGNDDLKTVVFSFLTSFVGIPAETLEAIRENLLTDGD